MTWSFKTRGVRQLLLVIAGMISLALLGRSGPIIPDALGQTLPRISTPTPTPAAGNVAVLGAGASSGPAAAAPSSAAAAVSGGAPSVNSAAGSAGSAATTDAGNAAAAGPSAAGSVPVAPGDRAVVVVPVQQPVALPRTGVGFGHDQGPRPAVRIAVIGGLGLLAGIALARRRPVRRWSAAAHAGEQPQPATAPDSQRSSIP